MKLKVGCFLDWPSVPTQTVCEHLLTVVNVTPFEGGLGLGFGLGLGEPIYIYFKIKNILNKYFKINSPE